MGLRTKLFGKMGFRKRHPLIDLPNKIFQPMEAQKQLLRGIDHPVIFDVGAFEGQTAVAYRRAFPDACIYSFEPHPDVFATLSRTVAEDSRVTPIQLALSDRDGVSDFHVSEFPAANSLLPIHDRVRDWAPAELLENRHTFEVQTARLDTFCTQEKVGRVDLLKIDAQGTDLAVLKGASHLLEDGQIGLVIAEMNIMPHYEGQCKMGDLIQWMEGHGYRLFDIFGSCHNLRGQLMWCDLLFTSPTLGANCYGSFR